MTTYIKFPIEVNTNQLAIDVYNYIKARAPQWNENDANIEVWVIQALATLAGELLELASDVPDDIFRYFGATLLSIPPIDATQSTVFSTWTVRDTAGYTIADGTQVAIRNSVGDLIPFVTVGDVVIPAGLSATPAGAIQMQSINPGAETAGLGGAGIDAALLDTLDYVTEVQLTGVTSGGQDAEDDDVYLARLATNLRLLSRRPILPSDFAILARNVAGVYRAVAIDGYNPFHNLLTLNEASAETDASGWSNIANTTVGSTAAQAADGAKSVSATAIAAADMTLATPATAGTGKPVTPGDTITELASIRANTTVRSCQVGLQWLDVANAQIGATIYGVAANDSNAAWTNYSVTGVAPPLAVRVRVIVKVIGAAIGEVHYIDKGSIRRGSTTDWVPGGTLETGNPRMVTVAAIDINGDDVSGPILTAIQTLLTAQREVNFITYAVGAKRTLIDVTFSAKVNSGYDPVDVSARAVLAIQAYLNDATWGNQSNDPQDWTERTVVR